jgi:hypothetical protein
VEGVEESWRTAAVTKRGLARVRVLHTNLATQPPLGLSSNSELVLEIELATVAVKPSPRHCKRIYSFCVAHAMHRQTHARTKHVTAQLGRHLRTQPPE